MTSPASGRGRVLACRCGECLALDELGPGPADFLRKAWECTHIRPECAPTTPEGARRAVDAQVDQAFRDLPALAAVLFDGCILALSGRRRDS